MAKQIINIGQSANDKRGDPIRTAFLKVNENFTELYSAIGADAAGNELVNGSQVVSLGNTGIITLPHSSYLESTDTNLKIGAQGSVTIRSNATSNITTKSWEFDSTGKLTLPNSGTIDNSTSTGAPTGTIHTFINDGADIPGIDNTDVLYLDNTINAQAIQAGWVITFANDTQKTVTTSSLGMEPPYLGQRLLRWDTAITLTSSDVWPLTVQSSDYSSGVNITKLELTPEGTTTWTFDSNGVIKLPVSGDIVDSTGATVLGAPTLIDGGNASTQF